LAAAGIAPAYSDLGCAKPAHFDGGFRQEDPCGKMARGQPPATVSMPRPTTLREELWALSILAGPLAAAQAGVALMGITDTAVVGRLGAGQLGSVGLGNGLFFFFCVMGIGVMLGLDPLISQAVGAGETPRARALIWQSFWLALAATLVLTPFIAASPLLLPLFHIDAELARGARDFVFWRLPGLLPVLLFIGLRSYLQAVGRARVIFWAAALANVGNLFGDLLFVFGGAQLPAPLALLRGVPRMGAAGSALSTSLCSLAQALVLVWACRADAKGAANRAPDARELRLATNVGLPAGLQLGAEVGVFALAGLLAGGLGRQSVAAHQLAITLASFTFSFAVGIGNAGGVRVGLAIGADETALARRRGLLAIGAGSAFMALSGLCFLLFPGALARAFGGSPDIVAAALPLLAVTAVFQISDGVQGVTTGVLRGAGDTTFSFLANLVGHYLIGLPLAILLTYRAHLGVVGLWWGLCGGLSAVAIAVLARFLWLSARPIAALEPREAQP
jgi:MATE family multidrug resistance protein